MDHPWLPPNRFGQSQFRAALGEHGHELAADKLRQSRIGEQEVSARRTPGVVPDAAPRRQAVDMGMVDELLRPGVEHRKHANVAAHMARVAGQFDNGLRRGLHEQRVGDFLPAAQRLAQFIRHGDGDMKVRAGQKFALPRFEPSLRLIRMAFGTASVPAGMVGIDVLVATIATPEMPAERFGAAGQNVRDGAAMRGRNSRAMRRKVAVREAAEDVRNLGPGCARPYKPDISLSRMALSGARAASVR